MIDDLAEERDAPGQVGRDEAAEQRPDRGRDRRRRADEGVRLALHAAGEVAVDERLHRRQQQRRPEPADDGPEDDDGGQALRERHRQRAGRIPEQAEDVGALAPDQVADLAADEDERGGDERLERDRRLDAARGGVEVVHHGGDRHVHERRVHHQHEHRHGEEDRDPLVSGRLLRRVRRLALARRSRADLRERPPRPHRPQRVGRRRTRWARRPTRAASGCPRWNCSPFSSPL